MGILKVIITRQCHRDVEPSLLRANRIHTTQSKLLSMVKLVELVESIFTNEANMFNIRVGVVGWEHPSYGIYSSCSQLTQSCHNSKTMPETGYVIDWKNKKIITLDSHNSYISTLILKLEIYDNLLDGNF